LDAAACDDLGKDVIDKEVVEKVSQIFMKSTLILSANELLCIALTTHMIDSVWYHDTYPIVASYSPTGHNFYLELCYCYFNLFAEDTIY